jgi:hypothetical protein
MVGALKLGSQLSAGISHGAYQHTVTPIADNIRESLISDLD